MGSLPRIARYVMLAWHVSEHMPGTYACSHSVALQCQHSFSPELLLCTREQRESQRFDISIFGSMKHCQTMPSTSRCCRSSDRISIVNAQLCMDTTETKGVRSNAHRRRRSTVVHLDQASASQSSLLKSRKRTVQRTYTTIVRCINATRSTTDFEIGTRYSNACELRQITCSSACWHI